LEDRALRDLKRLPRLIDTVFVPLDMFPEYEVLESFLGFKQGKTLYTFDLKSPA